MPVYGMLQNKIWDWLGLVFGDMPEPRQPIERAKRFGEEAIELLQAVGIEKLDVLNLVDYVYNRPVGMLHQELGGAGVTLYALATAINLDLDIETRFEIDRCYQPKVMEKVRSKQVSKQLAGIGGTPIKG